MNFNTQYLINTHITHTHWEFRDIHLHVQSFTLKHFALGDAIGTLLFDLVADAEFKWNSIYMEMRMCVQSLASVMTIFCTMSGRFSASGSSLPLSEFPEET